MSWWGRLFSRCAPTLQPDLFGTAASVFDDEEGRSLEEDLPTRGQRSTQAPAAEAAPATPTSLLVAAAPRSPSSPAQQQKRQPQKQQPERMGELEQATLILSIIEAVRKEVATNKGNLLLEFERVLEVLRDSSSSPVPLSQLSLTERKQQEEQQLLRVAIVRTILNWERRGRVKHELSSEKLGSSDGVVPFLASLVAALGDEQQRDLYIVLRYLPPAVTGDEEAKQTTRVFLDINKDIRHAQGLDKKRLSRKDQFLEIVTGVLLELLQQMGGWDDEQQQQQPEDKEEENTSTSTSKGKEKMAAAKESQQERRGLVSLLLGLVDSATQRERLVLEQLLLAREFWFPAELSHRDALLALLFRPQNMPSSSQPSSVPEKWAA
ncbi:hypothetical protein QOT17_008921 [Balamuthia mandrillaris]